mmetsp:Transcript_145368/g.253697  ORF Transcript_145368/g.253697 Transcript_145368/m.253697 type:complete len:113 (-) Transcript_145368:211-549(-)
MYAVNDGAVMEAWAKEQGLDSTSFFSFAGDPTCALTKALGLVLDHAGPVALLGGIRCKRFSMLIEDNIIKSIHVAYTEEDPAGVTKATLETVLADPILSDLDKIAQKETDAK